MRFKKGYLIVPFLMIYTPEVFSKDREFKQELRLNIKEQKLRDLTIYGNTFIKEGDKIIVDGNVRIKVDDNEKEILKFRNTRESGHGKVEIDTKNFTLKPYDLGSNSATLFASGVDGDRDIELATGNDWIIETEPDGATNLTIKNPAFLPILDGLNTLYGLVGFTNLDYNFQDGFIGDIEFNVQKDEITVDSDVWVLFNFKKVFGGNLPPISLPAIQSGDIILSQEPEKSSAKITISAEQLLGNVFDRLMVVKDGVENLGRLQDIFLPKNNRDTILKNKQNIFTNVSGASENMTQMSSNIQEASDSNKLSNLEVLNGVIGIVGSSQFQIDLLKRGFSGDIEIDLSAFKIADFGVGLHYGAVFYPVELIPNVKIPFPVTDSFGISASLGDEFFLLSAQPTVRATQTALAAAGIPFGIGIGLTDVAFNIRGLAKLIAENRYRDFYMYFRLGVALADSESIALNIKKVLGYHLFKINGGIGIGIDEYGKSSSKSHKVKFDLEGEVELLGDKLGYGYLSATLKPPAPNIYLKIGGDLGVRFKLKGAIDGNIGIDFKAKRDAIDVTSFSEVTFKIPKFEQTIDAIIDTLGIRNLGTARNEINGKFPLDGRAGLITGKVLASTNTYGWFGERYTHSITLHYQLYPNPKATSLIAKTPWIPFTGQYTHNFRSLDNPISLFMGDIEKDTKIGLKNQRGLIESSEIYTLEQENRKFLDIIISSEKYIPKFKVTTPDNKEYSFDDYSISYKSDINSTNLSDSDAIFIFNEDSNLTIFAIKEPVVGDYKIELLNQAKTGACDLKVLKENERPKFEFLNTQKYQSSGYNEIFIDSNSQNVEIDFKATDSDDDALVEFFLVDVTDAMLNDDLEYELYFDEYIDEGVDVEVYDDGYYAYIDDGYYEEFDEVVDIDSESLDIDEYEKWYDENIIFEYEYVDDGALDDEYLEEDEYIDDGVLDDEYLEEDEYIDDGVLDNEYLEEDEYLDDGVLDDEYLEEDEYIDDWESYRDIQKRKIYKTKGRLVKIPRKAQKRSLKRTVSTKKFRELEKEYYDYSEIINYSNGICTKG